MGSSSERRRGVGPVVAWALASLCGASEARAANAAAPRVPPSFLDSSCMEIVVRDEDPTTHFTIGIPFEDTARTDDELPDSRTLQFFALCRGPEPMQPMPAWIDEADVERASALDPAASSPADSDVLSTAAPFAGVGHDGKDGTCIVPIVAVDARIPITCEATLPGIEWDTTGVPAGAYEVWGYTFEPVQSLWTPRPGVVRIVDADDDASAGPAVAWSWPLTEVTAGLSAGVTLTGCAAGSEGTRVAIEWATAVDLDADPESAWVPLTELELLGATALSVPLLPPPEVLYQAVFVRATATDPHGRSFVATTRAPIVWRPGCDAPDGGEVVLADGCGASEVASTLPGPSAAGGCDAPEPEPERDGAGDLDPAPARATAEGCRVGHPSAPASLMMAIIVVAIVAGRRRQSPTRRSSVRSCASSPRT